MQQDETYISSSACCNCVASGFIDFAGCSANFRSINFSMVLHASGKCKKTFLNNSLCFPRKLGEHPLTHVQNKGGSHYCRSNDYRTHCKWFYTFSRFFALSEGSMFVQHNFYSVKSRGMLVVAKRWTYFFLKQSFRQM